MKTRIEGGGQQEPTQETSDLHLGQIQPVLAHSRMKVYTKSRQEASQEAAAAMVNANANENSYTQNKDKSSVAAEHGAFPSTTHQMKGSSGGVTAVKVASHNQTAPNAPGGRE